MAMTALRVLSENTVLYVFKIAKEILAKMYKGVQHYVIKFVSDLQQVSGFLWVLRFPPSIKLTATI
jgi:hypothetical protein